MNVEAGINSTSDIINNSTFADWFANQLSNFTPMSVVAVLIAALISGLIMALVYKKTYRGVLYSPSFAQTLVMMCVITSPVVMAIGTNIALSMGMVGALSIVRFRTAVKEPQDNAYLFWAITMGILLGGGQYVIGAVVLLGISIIVMSMSFFNLRPSNSYILVVHYNLAFQQSLEEALRYNTKFLRLRSKSFNRNGAEATYELRQKNDIDICNVIDSLEGVTYTTLVSFQSETGA